MPAVVTTWTKDVPIGDPDSLASIPTSLEDTTTALQDFASDATTWTQEP